MILFRELLNIIKKQWSFKNVYEFLNNICIFFNHSFLKLEETLKFRDAEISSTAFLTDGHTASAVIFLIMGRSLLHKGAHVTVEKLGCLKCLLFFEPKWLSYNFPLSNLVETSRSK